MIMEDYRQKNCHEFTTKFTTFDRKDTAKYGTICKGKCLENADFYKENPPTLRAYKLLENKSNASNIWVGTMIKGYI